MLKIHSSLTGTFSNRDMVRYPSKIPTSHTYHNPDRVGNPIEIYNKIVNLLPKNLIETVKLRYFVGDKASSYIQEYARFMTMVYFSKFTLTPSEEIDHVWHNHQFLTVEYRNFCISVFGKLVLHTPTTGGQQENLKYIEVYQATIEYYKFLFNENVPASLWPPAEYRFDPNNFVGCWYSFPRLYQCAVRVVEMHKNEVPADIPSKIMGCYFA